MGLKYCLRPQSADQDLPFNSGEFTLLYGPGPPSMDPGHMGQNHPDLLPWTPWNPRKVMPRGTPIAPTDCRLWVVGTKKGQKGQKFNILHRRGRDSKDPEDS
ncbi:hypothetical protein O181_035307 [Austropuccinia psidii MF-1]|uniref:Uncharacterized protein n=1 Tax=Austropuccinia psidii MF-1 TaxID=1389203 RepID=A0A9Q3D4X8_9BASI|nr:hypothetical protein [Austropuccinia psidii MF-1]